MNKSIHAYYTFRVYPIILIGYREKFDFLENFFIISCQLFPSAQNSALLFMWGAPMYFPVHTGHSCWLSSHIRWTLLESPTWVHFGPWLEFSPTGVLSTLLAIPMLPFNGMEKSSVNCICFLNIIINLSTFLAFSRSIKCFIWQSNHGFTLY